MTHFSAIFSPFHAMWLAYFGFFLAILSPFSAMSLAYFELALLCVRHKRPLLHSLLAVGAVILVAGVGRSLVPWAWPLSLVPLALLSGGAVVAATAQHRQVFAIAFTAAVVMVFLPFHLNWILIALAGTAMLAARAPHAWQRLVLAIVLTAVAVAFFFFAASTLISQRSDASDALLALSAFLVTLFIINRVEKRKVRSQQELWASISILSFVPILFVQPIWDIYGLPGADVLGVDANRLQATRRLIQQEADLDVDLGDGVVIINAPRRITTKELEQLYARFKREHMLPSHTLPFEYLVGLHERQNQSTEPRSVEEAEAQAQRLHDAYGKWIHFSRTKRIERPRYKLQVTQKLIQQEAYLDVELGDGLVITNAPRRITWEELEELYARFERKQRASSQASSQYLLPFEYLVELRDEPPRSKSTGPRAQERGWLEKAKASVRAKVQQLHDAYGQWIDFSTIEYGYKLEMRKIRLSFHRLHRDALLGWLAFMGLLYGFSTLIGWGVGRDQLRSSYGVRRHGSRR